MINNHFDKKMGRSKIFSKSNQEFRNKFYFKYIITFFILSILLKASNFTESYIELTINKIGTINLYSKYKQFYNFSPPNRIEINGVEQSYLPNINDLNNTNNKVKLIWENAYFTNISYMFYNCSNITEIDLSNFEFSNIIDMNHIFSGCTSLKRIEFGDFNTQNVVDMSYMFYNCTSLDSLELSGFHNH